MIRGIGASPGIAVGRALLLDRRRVTFPKIHVARKDIPREIERFQESIATSVHQIQQLRKHVADTHGGEHLKILEAHELMLQDALLVQGTKDLITSDEINAEWALKRMLASIKEFFNKLEDDYFRERRSDVEFVGDRIMRNLTGQPSESLMELVAQLKEPAILVAHSLSPADTIQLRGTHIAAFCTNDGTKTAHTAIVARSLEIPAVVGVTGIAELIGVGDMLVVDGDAGEICLRPTRKQIEEFEKRYRRIVAVEKKLKKGKNLKAVTLDGFEVQLSGNVDVLEELDSLTENGGRGVGLYRTEYLFLNRRSLPSEAEQFAAYKEVLKRAAPYPATIRTLDIGGDKLDFPGAVSEQLNPFFGLRAIRYCLKERTLFRTQLRAMLRASVHGKLRLLVPFITDITEVRAVRQLVDEVRAELKSEGQAVSPDLQLGVMIEIPSAALISDILAREVDFFSVGTNDLIQYTLAISRDTTEIGYLYHPLHPAVLRVLRLVSDAAHRERIHLGMCGEMAGEPLYTLILVGFRFSELSMSPRSIPIVREIIQRTRLDEARKLVDRVFRHATYREVEQEVGDYMHKRFPDLTPLLGGESNGGDAE